MRDKLFLLTFLCAVMLAITCCVTVYGPFASKSRQRFSQRMMVFTYVCAILQVLLTFAAYLIYGRLLRGV